MNVFSLILATLVSLGPPVEAPERLKIDSELLVEAIVEGRSGEAVKEMSLRAKTLSKEELVEKHGFGRKEVESLFSAKKIHRIVNLKAEGLPKYHAFYLHQIRADGSSSAPLRLRVDKNGRVMCFTDEKSMLLENHLIFLGGFQEHEPIHFVITSEKNHIYLGTTVYPRLKEVVSEHGAKLNIEPMDSLGTFFLIRGEGFEPNETIELSSTSCDEKMSIPAPVDGQGALFISCNPKVTGQMGGDAEIEVQRQNGETLVLGYQWGASLIGSLLKR